MENLLHFCKAGSDTPQAELPSCPPVCTAQSWNAMGGVHNMHSYTPQTTQSAHKEPLENLKKNGMIWEVQALSSRETEPLDLSESGTLWAWFLMA